MFSDPQFWVAIAFFIFIAAIFLPVKKMVTSNLDSQIDEIKNEKPVLNELMKIFYMGLLVMR